MSIVNGYILTETIGKGSYGEVFKARCQHNAQLIVAVKRISRKSLCSRAVDNLVDEISILKTLRHRHIAQLLDFTWDKSYVYMFMEYLSGGDLSGFLRLNRNLPEQVVHYFLQQLAFALHYLFERNVVHMDIKPQNILLTSSVNPTLKITDFGFAQSIKKTVQMNELRGSLLYMDPQIYCHGVYDKSCDLWSTGAILFECLFGSAPFACASVEELKGKLISLEPIQIPLKPKISDDARDLLSKLLERNPRKRINHEEFFIHPFIDLSHAPCEKSLHKAIDYLEKGQIMQNESHSIDAYLNYREGLLHLTAAFKYETNASRKKVIYKKLLEYITVAENLKKMLDQPSEAPVYKTNYPILTEHRKVKTLPKFDSSQESKTPIDYQSSENKTDLILPDFTERIKRTNSHPASSTSSSVLQFKSVATLAKWFDGQSTTLTATDNEESLPLQVKTVYQYSIQRLNDLEQVVESTNKSLLCVITEVRNFHYMMQDSKFQAALKNLEDKFSDWLIAVKNDDNCERQKSFRSELHVALDCAEKIKLRLKNKDNLSSLKNCDKTEKEGCLIS